MTGAAPLDPATPEGARAEAQLNQVLASVMTRLDREAAAARTTPPPATTAVPGAESRSA